MKSSLTMRLAKARAKKKEKAIPESKKDLMHKLRDIVDELDLSNPTIANVKGIELELYPISALSYAIGRTPTSIRLWEADGILPKSTFRSRPKADESIGNRLYAPLQIALVVYLSEKYQISQGKKLKGTPFVDELHSLWNVVKQELLKGNQK